MKTSEKKLAIQAYKERKRLMGVYEVRCSATGEVWVGKTRNLDTQRNHIWFSLRLGSSRVAALQQAWNEHGEEAFSFTPLAQLDDEATAYPDAKLNEMLAVWRQKLGAQAI
jgi:hypothetical protein